MKKRLLSWLMALTLCLALLPAAALANGNGVEDLRLTGEQETILSGEEGNAAPGEQQETQLAEGALLPAAAPAAEPAALMASGLFTQAAGHDHCLCGAAHKAIGDHTDANASQITFTEWTDELAKAQYNSEKKTAANSLPKQGNNYYYLTQDVELSTSWKPADGTVPSQATGCPAVLPPMAAAACTWGAAPTRSTCTAARSPIMRRQTMPAAAV